MVNPNIFRAYDIRGIYPQELNERTAYLIGCAFVKFLGKRKPKIVVGRDNRLSSPPLLRGLEKGVLSGGATVVDIGLATTPMFYWACAYYGYDGGIQITASHNPPQYNGFKLVGEKAKPISEESGLKEIKEMTEKLPFLKTKKGGKIIKKTILEEYLDFNFKNFNSQHLKSLKIVFDTANAVTGILVPHLKKRLPIKIYSLFEKLDGKFPNHSPDPLFKGNLSSLQKEVKNKKAHFGVAFDGDGDRICFVDEKGEIITGDLITAFLADLILSERPGEKILYDIRSSNIVRETIEKLGGQAVESRIGHSFIKEKMRKENIFFGGELSGHYYHKEHYFCESPLYVLLKIGEKISREKKKMSEFIKPYRKYFSSGEINFVVKNKEEVLKNLERKFLNQGKISKIDGLRVDFSDWWFLARPSGTEDLLKLSIDAKTKKLMIERKKKIVKLIPFFS